MSAIDELRRMLDERGVEWRNGLKGVTFVGDWCFVEYDNGKLAATCEPVLTPEQAIAATLGDAFTREECEASFVHGYSLGTLPVGSDPQWDENRQTVDEHMAELGWVRERTCRIENTKGEWFCSCCGEVVASDDPWCELFTNGNAIEELWNYCPSCGAKVVSE